MKIRIAKTFEIIIDDDDLLKQIKNSDDVDIKLHFNDPEIEKCYLGFDGDIIKVIAVLKEKEE